ALANVEHRGLTAKRIARNVLHAAGVADPAIDARLDRWCEAFAERYLELLVEADTSGWEARPDAAEALSRLRAEGVQLALVTGNPEPMARARLLRLRLERFFPRGQGAFGCEAEERAALLELARERAGDWPAAATAEIGDAPTDVASAKAAGFRSIAITSHRARAEQELAGADEIVGRHGRDRPRSAEPSPLSRRICAAGGSFSRLAGATLSPWRRRRLYPPASSFRSSPDCPGSARSTRWPSRRAPPISPAARSSARRSCSRSTSPSG